MILRRADRLNEAVRRYSAKGVWVHGMAVADLERAAVVVPFRDEAEVHLLEPMERPAQAQTHQGRQTEIQTACALCQGLRMLYLAILLDGHWGIG